MNASWPPELTAWIAQLASPSHSFSFLQNPTQGWSPSPQLRESVVKMGDTVQIDKNLFHERLSAFLTRWKNDKRSGDALFGGVSSIVILMGKSDEAGNFHKNGAFQLWLLGYEFPATLMLLTTEKCVFVTTKKKGKDLVQTVHNSGSWLTPHHSNLS